MSNKIYILDDDSFFAAAFKETLEDMGLACQIFPAVESFESIFPSAPPKYLLVDLAVPLANTRLLDITEARGGHETGIALLRKVRKEWQDSTLVLITGNPSHDAQEWCKKNSVQYLLKPIERQTIERILGLRRLRVSVVHGRNVEAVNKIKDVFNKIDIEPSVLMERPNNGRTVIEKFEEVSFDCDCAAIVLTPDDFGGLAGENSSQAMNRVRQNVIFELGYFCGSFGRRSGRVILIQFVEFEIPSNLAGVIRLDGRKELNELAEAVEAELRHLINKK